MLRQKAAATTRSEAVVNECVEGDTEPESAARWAAGKQGDTGVGCSPLYCPPSNGCVAFRLALQQPRSTSPQPGGGAVAFRVSDSQLTGQSQSQPELCLSCPSSHLTSHPPLPSSVASLQLTSSPSIPSFAHLQLRFTPRRFSATLRQLLPAAPSRYLVCVRPPRLRCSLAICFLEAPWSSPFDRSSPPIDESPDRCHGVNFLGYHSDCFAWNDPHPSTPPRLPAASPPPPI